MPACSYAEPDRTPVEHVELAIDNGRYATAQELCDSLILGPSFGNLSVNELCRLSLAFMRLSENTSNEEANTAFAARSLQAAIERDSDSTIIFLNSVPVEDQARLALITAINEAHNAPAITDTVDYEDRDSNIVSNQ